ncbi:TraR/DksA family transcriptional regulator [Streptomyces sp. t39]|uniref:TraR/DksA family transcriptional regulator n=1 Tax=Streptomyces sp. t39 TaxID=1828156 RepID=UPI0011CD37B1|nr:hypothetical protein EAO77_32750 [Streptomyces sp. t39]
MKNQTAGVRTAGPAPEDLDALRRSLREQRAFRREQLRRLSGPRPAAPAPEHEGRARTPDREAHASAYGTRARAAEAVPRDRLAASARMVLADVEAALARMDEGRYGSCHLCTRPIALARLTVVPQARYCGRCQHVREAGR